MTEVRFFVSMPRIVGKGRPRFNGKTKRTYTPQPTRDAERLIARECFEAFRLENLETVEAGTPVRLHVVACFRCPQSWPKARQNALNLGEFEPCIKTPDADNILKLVCDGLNGIAYADDRQIFSASILRKYVPRDKAEGLDVSLFW